MKKHLKFLIKHTKNFGDYLIASKPPRAGEPRITANVTIMPKTTPIMTKRMFISKIDTS